MCVPFSGHHEYRSPEDNYNFYQSSTRMAIECAFGMLVRLVAFWIKARFKFCIATGDLGSFGQEGDWGQAPTGKQDSNCVHVVPQSHH
jgi:hypothetical protein